MSNFSINIIDPQYDNEHDSVDVQVIFMSNRYVATFFTMYSVRVIMDNHAKSGESAYGKYFFAPNSLIVRDLKEETLYAVIKNLIEEDEFVSVFELIDKGDD
mgnify:CR=1 FL=1